VRESIVVAHPAGPGRDLARAIEALASAEVRLDPPSLPLLLALLACGRVDRVRPLLIAPAPTPILPVILDRYIAWSGDLYVAAAAWQQARDSLTGLTAAAPGMAADSATVLAAAGLAALQRTAADLGDARLAAALRQRAHTARATLADRPLAPEAAELAAMLGWAPLAAVTAHGLGTAPRERPAPRARGAHRDRPAPGGGAAAVPTAADGSGLDPHAAARSVLDFCLGTLGLDPDATRHRLRLRPRLTADDDVLEVRGIGFADGTVALHCRLEPGRLTCRLIQDSGAIPVTVLLEPVLPARFRRAEVDGTPADLEPRQAGGDTILPVQLVLDAERTLVVDLQHEGPST
jgi:hypothetical protein